MKIIRLLLALTLPLTAAVPAASQAIPPIVFLGVTQFQEPQLLKTLEQELGGLGEGELTAARADDAAFFVAIHYRRNGYSQVEVTETILPGGRLRLDVKEGSLTPLTTIRIQGNKDIPKEQLRGYLISATEERLGAGEGNPPFVEADLITGAERIRGFYLAEGFLDSVVKRPEIEVAADGRTASVTLEIQEGTRYRPGKITFSGDLVFFPKDPLLNELEPFLAQPYTPSLVLNMRRAVLYFYKKRGYYDAKVDAVSDPNASKDPLVPIEFVVESGPVYRFDGVAVSGTDRLDEDFLMKRFGKLSGETYNPERVDDIFREMMRTGLFTRLDVNQEAVDGREVRLKLTVEEAKAKELGFLLGYGTFEGPFLGVTTGDRNLFGNGRPIRASLEFSQRYQKGEVLYTDPWFLDSDYALRTRLYALTNDFDGFSKGELGGRVELSRKLSDHLELSVFYLHRDVSITNEGIDPAEIGRLDYRAGSVGFTSTLDHRDSLLNPRKGWILTSSVDIASAAFASDLDFVRGTIRWSWYQPVGRALLAFGARAGAIHPLGQSDNFPIDERFFNGGSRSVRSFAERDLGPKDRNGYPLGGETFTTFNVEWVMPLVGDLEWALFADAGSIGRTTSDGIGTMRFGIGTGLRYKLPVGPVRLDYGWNPSPGKHEDPGAFHFSFGFAF